MSSRDELLERVDDVRLSLLEAVACDEPLVVVKAPPGSGKTRLITDTAAFLRNRAGRVAIAAQTNSQANDICRRLAVGFSFPAVRFCSTGMKIRPDLGDDVTWVARGSDLPTGPCIVVGTSAKWGFHDADPPFDWLLIDEAWQLAQADFMLLSGVAARFVMVGDPGQIAPVVTIDTARWATADVPPHVAAPTLILEADGLEHVDLELPASFRLPHDTIPAVGNFYDFPFEAAAQPGDRAIKFGKANGRPHHLDPVLSTLESGSLAAATLPTPPEGPPLGEDIDVAAVAGELVARILKRGARLRIDDNVRPLEPDDIGLCATHRLMNARMTEALPAGINGAVVVDTPERWQGLERPLMIVIHPVSGTTEPTAFDLQTERLCVMASRHQVGLVVLGRDHLSNTLDELMPMAEQYVGLPDVTGIGLERHVEFWEDLRAEGRVTGLR